MCGNIQCVIPVIEVGTTSADIKMFFSGEIHGDERVGPQAVMESIKLICSSDAQISLNDRLLIFVPLINARGYYMDTREENGNDPNRDFPYDNGSSECLQTVSARVVHRIFYNYDTISLGITFHGGTQSISYPWGSFSHVGQEATDELTLSTVANALSRIAGEHTYKVGSMNDVVYPVHGGMEDWTYALGIEGESQCTYSASAYSQGRSLPSASIFLIEATNDKAPPEDSLGNSDELWITDSSVAISPVPRCIRMIISVAQFAKPRATFVPIKLGSSLPIILEGCVEATVHITPQCGSEQLQAKLSCNSIIAFLSLPNSEDCQVDLAVNFDESLMTQDGNLLYAQDRSDSISGMPERGACALIDSQYHVCISEKSIFVHPYLIHHRGTLEIHDIEGNIFASKSDISTAVSAWDSDLVVTDFTVLSVKFASDTDPSFVYSAFLYIDSESVSPDSGNSNLYYLFFILLLIPIGLWYFVLIRRRRHKPDYGNVASRSPISLTR